jgi:hypothetical protein
LWLAVAQGLGIAPLTAALASCLDQLGRSLAVPDRSSGASACPVCETIDDEAILLLRQSVDSRLLCLPHAALALRHNLPVNVDDYLDAVGDLVYELTELIRKADYRFRDEPRGAERDAWLRSLAYVAGAPGVRAAAGSMRRRKML